MARLKTNILGAASGKVGNVLLYERNGVACMRSMPGHYTDKKSEKQLRQRQKMQLVHHFIKPFKELLKFTFLEKGTGRSAYQSAQAYNMKYAITGEYPNQQINKKHALLSKGDLPLPREVNYDVIDKAIHFHWDADIPIGGKANDTLIVIRTDIDNNVAYKITNIPRSNGQFIWEMDPNDTVLDIWLAFKSADEKTYSNSIYIEK